MFSRVNITLTSIALGCLFGDGFALATAPNVAPTVAPTDTPVSFLTENLRGRGLQSGSLGQGASCTVCDTDECAPGLSCKSGQTTCVCGLSCGTGTCQPAPTPRPTPGPNVIRDGCFSATATVQTKSKGNVAMKDLVVGDQVLTSTHQYEEIYAFGHWNPTAKDTFTQIYTSQQARALELTADHMLRVNGRFVKASSVVVGDSLQTDQGTPTKVTRISSIHRRDGLYAPLTPSGTILVDKVVASTYISLQTEGNEYPVTASGAAVPISQHFGIHMVLSPYRMLCMGLKMDYLCHSKTQDGISSYVDAGINFARYADTLSLGMQLVLLVLAVFLVVPIYLVEVLVGPRWAPLMISFLVGLVQWHRSQRLGKSKHFKSL